MRSRAVSTLIVAVLGLFALGAMAGVADARQRATSPSGTASAGRGVIRPLSGEPDTGGQSGPQSPKSLVSKPSSATGDWVAEWVAVWLRTILANPTFWGGR